jgi:S1-C subfamily serine protease
VRPLSTKERKRLHINNGMKVTSVVQDSKIDRTNLKPNFVITQVNGLIVNTESDLVLALRKAQKEVKLKGIYEGIPDPFYYVFDLN